MASNAERGTVQTAERNSAPALVIDTTSVPAETAAAEGGAAGANTSSAVRTSRIQRPSSTVLQGTLIPAVLETALDSSRPGQVRGIVSRDITGFDGSQVLIPRGSRLVGNYEADLTDGQSRAFVEWTRLVRPDGVSMALGSPAADLQGRAGVPGRVNSRFLARFGSALLQTTLNLGASAAGRSLGGESSVVVALPGATQNLGASPAASTIRPTLNVAAGARVSVFVARDLEFSSGTPR
ncbi:MAG: TrbI/VirB10 family protein [Pseudomonadota bacterium]|nr:TrbI/VirB10 family protein [Pseudomonadota bacterium]